MILFIKRLILLVVTLAIIGLIAFFVIAPGYAGKARNGVIEHSRYPVSDAAQTLHDSLIVGDRHADSLLWKRDLTEVGSFGQVDIPRLQTGGVSLQVFTAVTKSPAGQNYGSNADDTFDNITLLAFGQLWPMRTWNSIYERARYQSEKLHSFEGDSLTIIRTSADLSAHLADRAAGGTAVGGLLGLEGAHPLEGDIDNLARLFDAGYRVIGLHHFFDNRLGGSLHGRTNAGLTDFGRQVVTDALAMNMVIDLAHSSEQVARDVVAMTDVPLLVSHTGLRSHCDVKRNFPDDLMQEIVATGGVIGIGYWADITCGPVTPPHIAAVIAKAIVVLGEDHVSLGSDFDGSVQTAFDTSELPALTSALLDEGLSEAQIAKVMGGNMVRVLQARLP